MLKPAKKVLITLKSRRRDIIYLNLMSNFDMILFQARRKKCLTN